MRNMLVKKLALNKFLNRIEDVIVREEVFELFKKLGSKEILCRRILKKPRNC